MTQHPDYNKDHVEKVKYLQSKLDELQPKMHNLVTFLANKDRTFDEFKVAAAWMTRVFANGYKTCRT